MVNGALENVIFQLPERPPAVQCHLMVLLRMRFQLLPDRDELVLYVTSLSASLGWKMGVVAVWDDRLNYSQRGPFIPERQA